MLQQINLCIISRYTLKLSTNSDGFTALISMLRSLISYFSALTYNPRKILRNGYNASWFFSLVTNDFNDLLFLNGFQAEADILFS